jgi:hypothetical protein
MVDRVKPLKIEGPGSGGTETDDFPTSLDKNEDFVDARGYCIQDDTSNDDLVRVSRDGDDMTFLDKNNTEKTLTELVAGAGGLTEEGHKILRQLIHFIDDGPAEGFTSGAYRETTGTVFPTNITWWESSGKTKKIVEKNITWTGANATTIEWKVYDTDGSTLLATVSDAISYSGVFETSRTRTITVS